MHNTMEWVQWTNGAHERGIRIQEMAEDVRELMKNSFVDKRKMKQKTKQNRSFNGPSISRKIMSDVDTSDDYFQTPRLPRTSLSETGRGRRCPETRVLATGGASANKAILQIIADIFNSPVYTIDVPNSAALGGCYRAKYAIEGGSFSESVKGLPQPICAAKPTQGLHKIYEDMLSRYQQLETTDSSRI